ncbi:hypothetical protein K32_15390 [Kaistia sp. 32K]|uniref:hypothetical protein n=1 Tax=Kaistia sp. 32K TaxID=2795690 RepID=UPI0019166F42|nr:hypothetical protein [Kaistia sp. 32K]BCP52922.1 hypothetical protein K32_15390 [Kaistia sp. 32K]
MQELAGKESEPATRIDAAFRNGSLTAIGIIVGFSLGFTAQWATDASAWMPWDYVAAIALAIGIVLQIKALAEMLEVNSLEIPVYQRAKNRFMIGLLITAFGVAMIIVVSALTI